MPPPIKYKLDPDGISIRVESGARALPAIRRSDHLYQTRTVPPDDTFNRGVRRGDTILVTGDRPRWALMRTLPEDSPGPDLIKLGDGRVQISCEGARLWLDECAAIETTFRPGATAYAVQDPGLAGIDFSLVVSQAEDWGLVACLTVTNQRVATVHLSARFVYGGLGRHGRTWRPAYLPPDLVDGEGDQVAVVDHTALMRRPDAGIPDCIAVVSWPAQSPTPVHGKAACEYRLELEPGDTRTLYLVAGYGAQERALLDLLAAADPGALLNESQRYYDAILAQARIETPRPVLDAGFRTSLWNLDSIYAEHAWLEGVHWWSAYWTNLFQISAAIALGQFERARRALEFFSSHGYGNLLASGKAPTRPEADWLAYYPYDGIFYYLYQLFQYVEATGDLAVAEAMWPSLAETLARVFRERDSNGTGLLDWRLGCNAFLYQADQLGMPGDAASPSLMAAGMLERLAALGRRLGRDAEAAQWAEAAQRIYAGLPSLWNPRLGAFYSHVDLQGLAHSAHYYTDLVYPVLYARLPDELGWQGLAHLRETLCFEPVIGEPGRRLTLMRVGDLRPSMFGNDSVLPAQMAEAARALSAIGDNEIAAQLLEAVALAGTIHTEAPGNFPERMDEWGKGEFNYLFGNPIGSFAYGVVAGLFGLSLTGEGQVLAWRPAFPDGWNHAELALPYAEVSYDQSSEQGYVTRVYRAHSPGRSLGFSVFLAPCRSVEVICNGKPIEPTLSPALNRTRLQIALPGSGEYELRIRYRPLQGKARGPAHAVAGQLVRWDLPEEIERVSDPQGLLEGIRIDKSHASGAICSAAGHHRLYFYLRDIFTVLSADCEVVPEISASCGDALYTAGRRQGGRLELPLSFVVRREATFGYELRLKCWGRELQLALPSRAAEFSLTGAFACEDVPPEGTNEVSYEVRDGDAQVIAAMLPVVLKGKDQKAQQRIEAERDRRSRPLDLSPYFNASTLWVTSKWRREDKVLDLASLRDGSGRLITPAGIFRSPAEGAYMAVVEFGRSHPYTRTTENVGRPASLRVPVNTRAEMLALLYASEVESRLTGSRVGWLRLDYGDGTVAETSLEVGGQLDTLYAHWASMTLPVPIGRKGDSIHVLRVPCDPARTLDAFQLSLYAADVQIGLIAANVIVAT